MRRKRRRRRLRRRKRARGRADVAIDLKEISKYLPSSADGKPHL